MTAYPHVPAKPPLAESTDQLRARIPGWGVDLEPADRPSVPRERFMPAEGVHWEIPESQPQRQPRERSIEHRMLTPVFGTACPPRLLSGRIRRLSYAKYSEGRAAHWLLLLMADRVDVLENVAMSVRSGRPDVPFVESGLRSEFSGRGLRSRLRRGRSDVVHHPLDPVVVAGPWLLGGYATYRAGRALARRLPRPEAASPG